jgi:hypothetical protein
VAKSERGGVKEHGTLEAAILSNDAFQAFPKIGSVPDDHPSREDTKVIRKPQAHRIISRTLSKALFRSFLLHSPEEPHGDGTSSNNNVSNPKMKEEASRK